MEASTEPAASSLSLGRSGRLEALSLCVGGDIAVLVRETGAGQRGRALLTTDKLADGERLVVMPLDDEVDVRVDGDALAVWLGAGSMAQLPPHQQPMPEPGNVGWWATVIGGLLLVLVLAFAVIGSAVVFTWLTRLFS